MNALPPRLRSRVALGLTAVAAEGRFALQVCNSCGKVHYPAQEICGACLGDDLRWKDVAPEGVVIARTGVHQSLEPGFSGSLPLTTGLVRHVSGATLLCFLHPDCLPDIPVHLHLRLDRGGSAVPVATPRDIDLKQEASLAHFSRSARGQNVLITDASHAVGQACARALAAAGAAKVWLGMPDCSAVAGDAAGTPVLLPPDDPGAVRQALSPLAPQIDLILFTPPREPAAGSVLYETRYAHPQYTPATIAAQKGLPKIQGRNRIWWAGAWTAYGFHEDGLKSGLRAVAGVDPDSLPKWAVGI